MIRLLAVAGAIAIVIVFIETQAPDPVELTPTPAALCKADEHTTSVLRIDEDGNVEVTPCPEES